MVSDSVNFNKFFIFLSCINDDRMTLAQIGREMKDKGGVAYYVLHKYAKLMNRAGLCCITKEGRDNVIHISKYGRECRRNAINFLSMLKK